MSIVFSSNFQGEVGKSFPGDANYSVVAGAGFFVPSHYGVGVRVSRGGQLVLQQSPTIVPSVQRRVFSRIYRLSGQPGGVGSSIFQVRLYPAGGSPGHFALVTQSGKLRLVNKNSVTVGESSAPLPFGVEFRVVYILDAGMFTAAIYPDTQSTTAIEVIGGAVEPIAIDVVRDGVLQAGGFPDASFDLIWPVDDNASDPGLRQYVYAVTNVSSGVIPASVSVEVMHENLPSGTPMYTVNFGDSTVIGPQSSPVFEHTYMAPGQMAITPTVEIT